MVDGPSYDLFVSLVQERVNANGKRVDAMFRVVVRCDCGKENHYSVFVPYVERVRNGSLAEAKGVRLRDDPDWKKDGGK